MRSTTWVFVTYVGVAGVATRLDGQRPAIAVIDDVRVQRGPDRCAALGRDRGRLHERGLEAGHGHPHRLEHVPARRIGRGCDGVLVGRDIGLDRDRRLGALPSVGTLMGLGSKYWQAKLAGGSEP